ncbi:MAG: glycoside hydrolase family 2 protein, partial [Lachnospiraceae bacterium]|nr:glycoside hydrolase family 2 protein [Lachnospiraceae bacterium]
MNKVCIDEKWTFRRGFMDSLDMINNSPGELVDLPHDGMIGTKVSEDAIPLYDSGYFSGEACNYTRYIHIPKEWKNNRVFGLYFDGAMMNAAVEVNGYQVCSQHYGYVPFYVDLTKLVTYGEDNRITVHLNTGMMPNSRWYTGTGLYRSVRLLDGPKVHIVPDGIYAYTKELTEDKAYIETRIEVENATDEDRLVCVEVCLIEENDHAQGRTDAYRAKAKRVIMVKAGSRESAAISVNLDEPKLWDTDTPNLYRIVAGAKSLGTFGTHFTEEEEQPQDLADVLFGVRTITADAC